MTTLYVDNIAPNLQSKISAPNLSLPTGSVIQVKEVTWTSSSNTNSTSYVNLGEIGSITTTAANSKILVITTIPAQIASNIDNRFEMELRHSVDSYTSSLERHNPANYTETNGGWSQPHLGWNGLHDAQQPSGTTIYYRTYAKKIIGGTLYYHDGWGQSPEYKCTLMEIAG